MTKQALLNPTNDYVFGRIFGYKGNEKITKGFLESITNEKYKTVEISSQVPTLRDLQDDKIGVLDIKAMADDATIFDIEMQVAKNENIAERILWYWSKLFGSSITSGKNYLKTKRTIGILIADFEIEKLYEIKKYHTSWHIREDEYSEIILTDKLELHIIELIKLEVNNNQNGKTKKLVRWLKFIMNPEEEGFEMSEDEDIKEAMKVLEQISQDEREREKAWLREKYIIDAGFYRQDGYEEGFAKGKEKGKKNEKIKIAKSLLKQKISKEIIVEVTGLTEKELEELK
ncbi:MAG: Rpn family recombination-promoting nuclease/putative transposase [Clostridia bacterium]|nr:Rpn family recombination-promoting nuclease/putative transposase [Clostridia bacterium]